MTKYQIGIGINGDMCCHLFPTQFTELHEATAVAAMRFGAPTDGWELGGNTPIFPAHYWPDGHWTNNEPGFNIYIFVLHDDDVITVDANGHWNFDHTRFD